MQLADLQDALPLVFGHLPFEDAVNLGACCRALRAAWRTEASSCFSSQDAFEARFKHLRLRASCPRAHWSWEPADTNAETLRDYHLLEAGHDLCQRIKSRTDPYANELSASFAVSATVP